MSRSRKAGFQPGQEDAFRRERMSPDDHLPVRNMADWGCTEDFIREPRYADRAYKLCGIVGSQCYNKISGIIEDILPPRMLGKQKFQKPDYMSPDQIATTDNRRKDVLTNFRDMDKGAGTRQDPRK